MRKIQIIFVALATIVAIVGLIVVNTGVAFTGYENCEDLDCNNSTCTKKCQDGPWVYWHLPDIDCPGRAHPPYLEWCIEKTAN
jgi:hypothetical protein